MSVLDAHKVKNNRVTEDVSYQLFNAVLDREELVQLSVLTAHCTHIYPLIRDNASTAHQAKLLHQWVSVLHAQKVLGPKIRESANPSHWYAQLQSAKHVIQVLAVENAARLKLLNQDQWLLQLQFQ